VQNRHGTNFIESWQDGSAFKMLALRKARNAELQADIERMKKSSKKKGAKPLEVGEVEDLTARLLVLKRVRCPSHFLCVCVCVALCEQSFSNA